jgi:hypothetical protein
LIELVYVVDFALLRQLDPMLGLIAAEFPGQLGSADIQLQMFIVVLFEELQIVMVYRGAGPNAGGLS